jgi:hypothetical protein
VAPTEQEIQEMADEEADEEVLSQAIEAFIAPNRAGRKRTATTKVIANVEPARQDKIRKTGGRGGHSGRGGSGKA